MTTASIAPGVITFPAGLPGFESVRHFVLVASESLAPFTLVRGTGDPGPTFVAIEPRHVEQSFTLPLEPADRLRLQAKPDDPLLWLALVTLLPDGRATVNLRAPLVINPGTMLGVQIVAAASPYAVDHPLLAA